MRRSLAHLLLVLMLVSGCFSRSPDPEHIPHGVPFVPLDSLREFDLLFSLHIRRHPDRPGAGVVTTEVEVTPRDLTRPVEGLRLAIWLPDTASEYYPRIPLTNEAVDISPKVPAYVYRATTFFPDFTRREDVQKAIAGSVKVKLVWKGDVRYVEVPQSAWQIHVEQP